MKNRLTRVKEWLVKKKEFTNRRRIIIFFLTSILSIVLFSAYIIWWDHKYNNEDVMYVEIIDEGNAINYTAEKALFEDIIPMLPNIFDYDALKIKKKYYDEEYYIMLIVSDETFGSFISRNYNGAGVQELEEGVVDWIEDATQEAITEFENYLDKPITTVLYSTEEMRGFAFVDYNPNFNKNNMRTIFDR